MRQTSPDGTSRSAAAALSQQPRVSITSNLDILRSTAVLLVLVDHVLEVWSAKHGIPDFQENFRLCLGRLGVLLFFVHTSLVLNFSLERVESRGWRLALTFLVRRAFRLYPLSILCVLMIFTFQIPSMPYHRFVPYSWGGWLSNLALITNLTGTKPALGPLWSLPVETQMYLGLPILFMLLGPTRSPRIALGLWVITAIFAWMFPTSTDLGVTDFAPCFVAGIVAYTLSGWNSRRLPGLLWTPFLLAMVSAFVIAGGDIPYGLYNPPFEWVFCLTLGLFIPLFHDSTFLAANSITQRIARYSYGIYLFHCIALWIGCQVLKGLPEPLQWATAAALTTVMSVGSYHVLEKPAIDLGARLTSAGATEQRVTNQSLATPRINPSA